MAITFYHNQRGYNLEKWEEGGEPNPRFRPMRFCVAVDLPTKEELLELSKPGGRNTIELKVGIACAHPKDQYNKKIGRELAKGRMKPVIFYFRSLQVKTIGLRSEINGQDRVLVMDSRPDQMSYIGEIYLTLKDQFAKPFLSEVYTLNNVEVQKRAEWYREELEAAAKRSK